MELHGTFCAMRREVGLFLVSALELIRCHNCFNRSLVFLAQTDPVRIPSPLFLYPPWQHCGHFATKLSLHMSNSTTDILMQYIPTSIYLSIVLLAKDDDKACISQGECHCKCMISV